ncbi:hypothetical protein Btru_040699 [Bulinus truncatus]|nr:hypothetical protein Btru_040699 [Bulinus truncatus]
MNLLYSNSDSDSDVVPDLKLPPLKGKKQRRKKSMNSKQQEPLCTAWTIVKIIIAICCFVTIVVLTGLSYWALSRLNELERQVSSCEYN